MYLHVFFLKGLNDRYIFKVNKLIVKSHVQNAERFIEGILVKTRN